MALFSYGQLHSDLNHRKTRALFVETCKPDEVPLMTLGRKDKQDLVILRDHFIHWVTEDPTEFNFAEFVFGDYAFWDNLSKCAWMEPHITEWRMVASVKRKSKAFQAIDKEIEGGRNALAAARFLIEEPWRDKRSPKVKAEVQKTAELAARSVAADVTRMKEFIKK